MDDTISRREAIDELERGKDKKAKGAVGGFYNQIIDNDIEKLRKLPSAQPERLTDVDFEIIRILLNADKEKLCNQRRWKEAEEYQRIIDRFMAFASAQQTGAECVAPITIEGDGTLMVTVGKNENISRVIVLYGDSIFCGVFYPDGEKEEK